MIGSLSLLVNLVVKKVPVINFKFVESINLERVDPDEFINRFMGWFESVQNKFTKCLKNEETVDEDTEEFTKMFNSMADAEGMVPKEGLKDLIKKTLLFEGLEPVDAEILEKIKKADLKHDTVSLEEFLRVRKM